MSMAFKDKNKKGPQCLESLIITGGEDRAPFDKLRINISAGSMHRFSPDPNRLLNKNRKGSQSLESLAIASGEDRARTDDLLTASQAL